MKKELATHVKFQLAQCRSVLLNLAQDLDNADEYYTSAKVRELTRAMVELYEGLSEGK